MIIREDYAGRQCVLFVGEQHPPLEAGDVVYTSRGERLTVLGGSAPHKPSSTGRVYVEHDTGYRGEFFPSVIGADWREL